MVKGTITEDTVARGRWATWASESWRAARAAPPPQQAYWVALGVVLALGTFLRLNGYLGPQVSFWLDEALWAPRFLQKPLTELAIRPIGFVWLTRQVVTLFDASEFWFRFLPNLAALLSLWLLPYVAARLLVSRLLRVLLVLLFALHPALVDLAKEFKPYSFEVLVHLLGLALYLRYDQTRKASYLYGLIAYLPIALLLAYNMAFALPGVLLLTFWIALKRFGRWVVVAILLTSAICLASVIGINRLSKATIERNGLTEAYWADKYDVFYEASPERGRLTWTLGKVRDMGAMIGLRRGLWSSDGKLSEATADRLGTLDIGLWAGLTAIGAFALARKRRDVALLCLAPLLTLVLVNAFGKWPLGSFRTNVFAAVYLFPLPLLGLELLGAVARSMLQRLAMVAIAADVLLGFVAGFDWHGHKRTWCQEGYAREALEALYELRKQELAQSSSRQRTRLVIDLYHQALPYYLTIHPLTKVRYRDFDRWFSVDKVGTPMLIPTARRRLKPGALLYVIASKASSVRALQQFASSEARTVRQREVAPHVVVMALSK